MRRPGKSFRASRTGSLLLLVACSGSSTSVVEYWPVLYDLDYTPPTVDRNAFQWVNLYLPEGAAPSEGWPVLLFAGFGGFQGSTNVEAPITPASRLPYLALSAGVAVAVCGFTSAVEGGPIPVPGAGSFDPPGETEAGQDHYDDDEFPIGFKDAVWVVQYLRTNAAAYALDAERFVTWGRSGAATTWAWVALGEDRADPLATDFRTASSRVRGAFLHSGQFWWPAFLQQDPTFGLLFPDASAPESQIADTLSATFPDYLVEASALWFGFRDAPIQALNSTTPLYLYAANAPGSTDYSLTSAPVPVPVLTDTLSDGHDGWFEYMLYERLLDLDQAAGTTFHADSSRLAVSPAGATGTIESLVVADEDELDQDQLAWLLERIAPSEPAALEVGSAFLIRGDELQRGVWLRRR